MQNNIRSHLIRLNMLCNEKCSFCNVTEETEPNYTGKNILEILLEVQKIIKKEGGVENVKITLSGGEPTLRKDLDKIVLGIKKLGIQYIELQTNASLLNLDISNKLVNAGINKFFISFHSHIKETFEEYVGLNGIFDLIVKNIKNLGNYKDIEVILNPVISKKNYNDLKLYFDFIKSEFPFVKYISLSFIQPHGEAKKNIDLMLDYEIINQELIGILDYANDLGFEVNNPYCGLPICVMGWDKYNKNCIEIIEGRSFIEQGKERIDNNKKYIHKCDGCIYKLLCGGVWNEYIEIYGDKGINTIKNY